MDDSRSRRRARGQYVFCLAKLKEVIFQQRDFNLYCLDDLPDLVDPVKVRFGVLGSLGPWVDVGVRFDIQRYSRLSRSAPICYLSEQWGGAKGLAVHSSVLDT